MKKENADKKIVLLTGATGFLGSYLLEALLKESYSPIILKRTYSDTWRIGHLLNKVKIYNIDEYSLEIPFNENQVDIVVHCATLYGRKEELISELISTNILFSFRLFEVAMKYNTSVFLNTDTILNKWKSPYSLSKSHFADWLQYCSNVMKIINIKTEHFYGPRDDDNKFICWLIRDLLNDKAEIRLTSGEQERDFIYITDVVNAYMQVISNVDLFTDGFNNLHIGTGNSYKIKDIVLMIKEVIENITERKNKTKLFFGVEHDNGNSYIENNQEISTLLKLGWEPKVDFFEGISKTILNYWRLYQ